MKKIVSYLLIVSMMFSLVGTGVCNVAKEEAKAEETCVTGETEDGFWYSINNEEVTITGYYGEQYCVIVPETIEGYKVTTIGESAFQFCDNMEEVSLPESITTLEKHSFEYCDGLTTLDIPKNVTKLEEETVYCCENLSTINVTESVEVIEKDAFDGCYNLAEINISENNKELSSYDGVVFNKDKTKVLMCPVGKSGEYTIPEGTTAIGADAFLACGDLNKIDIPNGVIEIEDRAFYGCGIESMIIPDGVVSIGESAFQHCDSMETIEIPESVENIGENAFEGCYGLLSINVSESNDYYSSQEDVLFNKDKSTLLRYPVLKSGDYEIPDSVTKIENYAFESCRSLTSIYIPVGVTEIGEGAFYYCGLASIDIPNGVTSIKAFTFSGCDDLLSINVPESVVEIDISAFSLADVNVSENNSVFSSQNGVLFNKDKTKVLYCPKRIIGEYKIPEGVTCIGERAFSDCDYLTNIDIPSGVTSIGDNAFLFCSGLTEVYIPEGVTYIGEGAFSDCYYLTTMSIPEGVTQISDSVFSSCMGLTSIDIPNTVTQIGNYAFYYCDKLTSVDIPSSVTSIGDCAFMYCMGITIFELPGNITSIGEEAFAECSSLKTINIPSGVTSIEEETFYNCSNLEIINIEEGVTSIANKVFSYCYALVTIEIPESVISIGQYAFSCCNASILCKKDSYAEKYANENGIEFTVTNILSTDNGIKYYVKDGCSKIVGYEGDEESIIIPSEIDGCKVTSIGESAFSYKDGIVSVYIPESVTSIGEYAFDSCYNLTIVNIPESVTNIGQRAFDYCYNLTISCKTGSYAEEYAKDNCINYTTDDVKVTAEGLRYSINEDKVTIIGYSGMAENLVIPDGIEEYPVTAIGARAFYDCDSLITVSIPETVTFIDEMAFACCDGLLTMTIPNGVTRIENGIFCGCTGLETINIPESVVSIEGNVFEACYSMTSINVAQANDYYLSNEGVLFNKNNTVLIFCPMGKSGEYTVPEGVTEIQYNAFQYCGKLTEVSIPESVVNIGAYAFDYCYYDLCIVCKTDSYAHEYAIQEGIRYKLVDQLYLNECFMEQTSFVYTGNSIEPAVSVKKTQGGEEITLVQNEDYQVGYQNNIAPGTAIAIITGIGKYKGAIELEFTINPKSITPTVIFDNTSFTYSGKVQKPTVTVTDGSTLLSEADYTVTYPSGMINAGNYRVTVVLKGNYSGSASKTYSILPLAVTGFTYDAHTDNSVTLKWTQNTSADGYVIQQYKGGKWTTIKTITKNSTVNYKVTGLKPSVSYEFRIRAYKNSGNTKLYSTSYTTKSVKTLPSTVKSFTCKSRTASTVTLEWTQNTSADGYVIQQYKGGKWTTIKTITSNSTVNYKVTGLKPSVNYKFRIRAYKNSGNTKLYSTSYTTKSVKTLPSTVKSFTCKSRTASTITLKWTKNTSADGYVIQQYKGGKWTTIKTITKNSTVSYKVTGLKPSTSYKFRIKAYKKDGSSKLYGTYSTKTVRTVPSTVKSFTYKSRTAKTITLKWAKNSSADGYVIQQYKGGKWKTIKTITSKSTVNYKIAGLKKNTTYKFRIKAYKKSGSTKLYGAYVIKSIKTTK